jgi:predicted AAA+ superfamily ATPase
MIAGLIKRFFQSPSQHFFLFGPRGTGKSTWLHQHYKDACFIDLLDPAEIRVYLSHPEQLEHLVMAAPQKTIIIDEVQKIPELLSVVHRLIEMKKGWQFILTGSSARKLKRAGVDLLAGRAIVRHMHPLMAAEMGDMFSLDRALQYGLLPHIALNPQPIDVLRAYIGLYLKEEVQLESLVRNIGHFARFLEVISFSHGSILNLSNIARECQVSRPLVEGYLSVLEDLLLCFQLPVFNKRAKRETITHRKFYYFDVGVFRFLRTSGPLDITSEIDGVALEGLVGQHLRAWNDYQGSPHQLFYWRTRHGVEVDFIVYGPDTFYAIEVKNGKHVHAQDLRGLKAFREDYPEATPFLLYRGGSPLRIDGIDCLPIADFLKSMRPSDAKLISKKEG